MGDICRCISEKISIKRVYDSASPEDGRRILVDGLWPRGLSKEAAQVDAWMREVAPSAQLRRWFGHRPDRFEEFRQRYVRELCEDNVRKEKVDELLKLSRTGRLTLLFAAKDTKHNHVVVLRDVLATSLKSAL